MNGKDYEIISDMICNRVCDVVKLSIQSYLENNHTLDEIQDSPKEDNSMAYSRVKVCVGLDEQKRPVYVWVGGNTQDERNDNIVKTYIQCGRIAEFLPDSIEITAKNSKPIRSGHCFSDYAENWFMVFAKPNIELSTALTYRRQLDLYWLPAFKEKCIEDIKASDVQDVLNNMGDVSKDTKKKAMQVINMILSQAVEDDIVQKNVSKSKIVKITGKSAKETEPYSVEQMQYLVSHIGDVNNSTDRAFLAIAALHPLRPEEVFGLTYGDIDEVIGKMHVRRAVTYPDRNQPVVKGTKTEASARTIDLVPQILQYIPNGNPTDFIFGGDKPLSYQQIKRMRGRIKKDIGFDDDIVPRRFRTTVLTDLYDTTKDIKQTQAAAGHTTADMTLKHYIKGRQQDFNTAAPVASRYGL